MNRTLGGFLAGFAITWGYATWRAHSQPPFVGVPDPTVAAVGGAVGAVLANLVKPRRAR